jgi:glycosidase
MHARRTARDAFFSEREDDRFFAPRRGDIVFADGAAVRAFAERINRGEHRTGEAELRPAELAAMALVHEVLHAVIGIYHQRYPASFTRLTGALESNLGPNARTVILDFLTAFPPPPVYRALKGYGDDTPEKHLERMRPETTARSAEAEIDEELLLLWVANQNPAYDSVRTIIADRDLGPAYGQFVTETRRFFEDEPRFGPKGETLLELLLAPSKAHPTSIFAQLEYIDRAWAKPLGLDQLPFWRRMAWTQDLRTEENQWFERKDAGPGPGEPLLEAMQFDRRREEDEVARFSADLNWMPNVILIAKSVYVWLDQLSTKYGRSIDRLDQIPDEELDVLAARGLNGLWLIGLFERSPASRRVKQMRGDREALASAYSLKSYDIAHELGGTAAYESLKARASARGIRLAADMVPNHVGIDGDWVVHHPEWFLQARVPPYPNYRFGAPDLSGDDRMSVFLEEGYWNKTDAAVVFRRHDNRVGGERFIYHGNDGTSMPWNDTAQLDYLNPEVRHAVIETILHVARMFPIIRFDAAMTLAKRHIQRLWYPLPGQGGAIPSRSDYAMTQEEFDAAIPIEFWREVVDTVAERAPDTLLLAEAFWMMEGYFVRTLGMHRVYNSAFMNMLKREENEKYRETIKNVLDFDPEILKRFVNFMNNPDEETAALQFGYDDKYFGTCVLMSTMPGLPMFGHGQIEGLREKYGMEYRTARSAEQPNEALIQRHEREIFPLLHKRYLFSGVEHFALYDFVADGGRVDEDVYAYSNGTHSERVLVVFNNKWKSTRGRIFASTHRGNVIDELGIAGKPNATDDWMVIRDIPHRLEYLRRTSEILAGGFAWELHAFTYHVLSGFRPVVATHEHPYDRLALELAGRGVPDVEHAVHELYLRPIHAPLREACSKGHIDYLIGQLDAADDIAARAALEERLGHIADGLDWIVSQRSGLDVSLERAALRSAGDRFAALHAVARAAAVPAEVPSTKALESPEEEPALASSASDGSVLHADMLLGLIQIEAILDLLTEVEPALVNATAKREETLPDVTSTNDASAADDAAAMLAVEEVEASAPPALPSTAKVLPQVEASTGVLPADRSTAKLPEPARSSATALQSAPVLPPSTASLPEASVSVASIETPIVTPTMWATREALLEEWELATPLVEAFSTIASANEARRRAALVLLAATLPTGPIIPAVRLALGSQRGQTFMDLHESDGTLWLNKERFEELARFLAEREAASGRSTHATGAADARFLAELAEAEGYRAERIAARLGPPPKIEG